MMTLLLFFQLMTIVSTGTAAKTWFSFGDSYSRTGFNMTSGALPSVGNPLGNPAYPGITSSNGENWVDFETTVYNTTLVLTYNVAYSGATVDTKLVASTISLTDQVSTFLGNIQLVPAWNASENLVSVWIGINDLLNSYTRTGDRFAFSDTLLDAHFALVEKLEVNRLLSVAGARNFLFVNVPPIDRCPRMLLQPPSNQALLKSIILDFNAKLAARALTLERTHSGVSTWMWDTNAIFTTILNSPKSYGFTSSLASVGDSPAFFWVNDLHPTRYVHKFITQDLVGVLNGFL